GNPSSEGRVLTVVGVVPAQFELPTGPVDFYVPFPPDAKQAPTVALFGFLRPGVSLKGAIDEANLIGSAIRSPLPANAPVMTVPRFDLQGVKEQLVRGLRPAFRVLLGTVVVVL